MGALLINYDGNIFGSDESRMIWENTKSDELVLGNINNYKDIKFHTNSNIKNILSDTFISCTPGCDECAYQPFCGSDPMHHLTTQGDHIGDKAKSFFCKLERNIFDYIMECYQRDGIEREIFDQWLSH